MKKFISILLVLILIIGVAAWYFVTYRLDGIIEKEIERAASTNLGSSVQVGAVRTSIKDGSLTISDVRVSNPPGYQNKHAMNFNSIEAAVDYDGLDIKRVIIDNPEVFIEEKGGKTNVAEMLAALERGDSSALPPDDPKAPTIVIRHFRMNGTRAAFESESLDTHSDLNVDAVELNNLEGTPNEVAREIAAGILKELSSEAATELLKAQARKKYEETESETSEN
jgi:hypothetical protein